MASSSASMIRDSSFSNTKLRSLLAGEALALYQVNPFRVLNIPTDSSLAQAQKHVQKLNVWRQMGEKVADEFAIREALQTLRDPQKRLVAELFWFHTDAFDAPGSPNAVALEKIRSGAWQEALKIWRHESTSNRNEESGRRALHNLAVLLHARVVTLEAGKNPLLQTLGGNHALPEGHLQAWQESLKAWQEYLANDDAWKHWKSRAYDIDDKRVNTCFISELREALPGALLQINHDLARRYADVNYGLAAGAHCRLMLESKLDTEAARAFCRTALDPLKKRVQETCESFKERAISHDEPLTLERAARAFARRMQGACALLSQIDPQKRFGSLAARENIAQTLHSVAAHAARNKLFRECSNILSLALTFADSPSLKNDLTETRQQASFLRDVWRKDPSRCLMCKHQTADWTIFTNSMGQERLIFLCQAHAEQDDDWQQRHMVPHLTRYWDSLPTPPARPVSSNGHRYS